MSGVRVTGFIYSEVPCREGGRPGAGGVPVQEVPCLESQDRGFPVW